MIDYLSKEHMNKCWVLNATGGTKLMSLAVVKQFEEYNKRNEQRDHPIIYTVTQGQYKEIQTLNEESDLKLDYESNVKLDDLVLANGFQIKSMINENDPEKNKEIELRKDLTNYIFDKYSQIKPNALGALHKPANNALGVLIKAQLSEIYINLKEPPFSELKDVFVKAQEQGLIEWEEGSKKVTFLSESACRYLSGGWFEEFTYLAALECNFDEVAMNVEGEWLDNSLNARKKTNNELDVLIRHNNQLLTIECKACNWDEEDKQGVIQKLSNLGDGLGGTHAKKLFISFHSITDAMEARCEVMKIDMCKQASLGCSSVREKLKVLKDNMD